MPRSSLFLVCSETLIAICGRWKAQDFDSLSKSSISFFNDDKPETAVSRWARARTRAAKVESSIRDIRAMIMFLS